VFGAPAMATPGRMYSPAAKERQQVLICQHHCSRDISLGSVPTLFALDKAGQRRQAIQKCQWKDCSGIRENASP